MTDKKNNSLLTWIKEEFLVPETLRYLIVGLTGGVVVNLGLYYILANFWFAKSSSPFLSNNAHAIASAMGWTAATIITFLGNKYYVFRSKEKKFLKVLLELLGSVGARGFSFLVTTFGMKLFVDMNIIHLALLNPELAHSPKFKIVSFLFRCFFGLFEIAFNYVANKFFIFKKKDKAE